jgi:hypothetical protein
MKRFVLTTALAALVLSAAPALATGPCDLTWWLDASGRLWMHHALEANCGIAEFTHDVVFGDGTIAVDEDGLCPNGMAICLCPFNTDVVVAGLAPGNYVVSWHWCEVDTSQPVPQEYCNDCSFTVTVPTAPPVPQPHLVGTQASGCNVGTVSGVPDEPDPGLQTWGTIKALYR